MSSFDTVVLFCPKCGEKMTEQSKAGSCRLKRYKQNNVPAEIAADLRGSSIICPVCDITFFIAAEIPRVSLRLIEDCEDECYD